MTTIYLVESHITKYNGVEIQEETKSLHAFLAKNCADDYIRKYNHSAGEVLAIREVPIK